MSVNPNTPPVAAADGASVNVAGSTGASGNVLSNDSDPNGLPLAIATVNGQTARVGASVAGTYGSLVLRADGTYDYVLYANAASLIAPGTTVNDVFQYTVSDGFGYTTTTQTVVQNLIPQSEAFNNASWIKFADSGSKPTVTANVDAGPNGGSTKTADKITLTGASRGLYYTTNVTGRYTFSAWVKLVSGSGNLTIQYYSASTDSEVQQTVVANGTWQRISVTFDGDGNANSNVAIMHGPGQSATGTFELWGAQLNTGSTPLTYVPTTGAPASATVTQTVPLTIGSNLTVSVTAPAASGGSPPVAIADKALVSVAGATQTSGNVLANDSDPNALPLSVATVNGQAARVGASVAGTYGSLVLRANGTYDYVLNAGAASLIAPGETVSDVFQYTISDGGNYTQTVSTITAQNLILQSEAFDDQTWARFTDTGTNPALTANVDTGPTGSASTADKITLTGADSGIYFQTNIKGQYTFSVWVKAVTGDPNLVIQYYKGSTDGVVQQAVVANGTWQRVSVSFVADGNTYSNVAIMHGGNQSATGSFELWGAQLNPGTAAQSYVPTAGHRDMVYADTQVTANPTANLVVSVSGADPASVAPNTLTFAGGKKGVVVNLAAGQWSRVASVLPLGDSITYGWTSLDYSLGQTNTEDGYRGPLWWDFANQSSLVNFVGPNTSGDALLPSQSHAGYPGWRSDELAPLLPNMLNTYRPDAVLLLCGTNDIFQAQQPAAHVAAMIDQMVKSVGTLSPQTHIYVATVTPINLDRVADTPVPGMPNDAQLVGLVNQAITAKVSALVAAGYNVSLVDMSNITLGEIADAAHPTPAGYAHLAQNFYNAILTQQPLAGGTPGGTAIAISGGVTTVIGSDANDLLIAGSADVSLSGGLGNDRLVAGSGIDLLTGGAGADQFVFNAGSGTGTVADFSQAAGDQIELDGFSGLTQFSQLGSAISQAGADTLINLSSFGAATTIKLANFSGTLTAQNFLFHS